MILKIFTICISSIEIDLQLGSQRPVSQGADTFPVHKRCGLGKAGPPFRRRVCPIQHSSLQSPRYYMTGRSHIHRRVLGPCLVFNLFLTELEAGKSESNAPADGVSIEAHFPGHGRPSSHCALTWWKAQGSSHRPLFFFLKFIF